MNLTVDWLDYAIFIGLVLFSMGVDHYLHKDNKTITLRSAVNWSVFWVAISFLYAGFLWWHHDSNTASLFVSGYVLEKILSVDNLFVFSAIFAWFSIPNHLRHRVLYWGIIGAIVFRFIFVVIGAGLLQAFGSYAELLFAGLIAYAAFMMLKGGDDDDEVDYENHVANKLVHKFWPVAPKLFGSKFFVRGSEIESTELTAEERSSVTRNIGIVKSTALYATPLLVCAAVIELSDVMFAFDSVPAVIAVSKEPLIVYSSMLFAILGLRTLYFVLEALKEMLHHLEKAIIVLLFFIAVKLALSASLHLWGVGYDISPNLSLLIVMSVLAVGVIASLLHKKPISEDAPIDEKARELLFDEQDVKEHQKHFGTSSVTKDERCLTISTADPKKAIDPKSIGKVVVSSTKMALQQSKIAETNINASNLAVVGAVAYALTDENNTDEQEERKLRQKESQGDMAPYVSSSDNSSSSCSSDSSSDDGGSCGGD